MPHDDGRVPRHHWHLRRINWFSTLTPSARAAVRKASKRREYRLGEEVFHPTRMPQDVYLLEEGLVRIFRLSADGQELTVGYVRPGEIFGEVSVITQEPRGSFAVTARNSTMLQIPRNVFLGTLRSSKPLYEVTKRIGLRLVRCQSRAEDLVFCDARTRLARLLVRLAREFGGQTDLGHAIALDLTGQDLATLIGTTRQTASVALAEMTRSGLVRRRGRKLILTDRRAVAQIAGLSGHDRDHAL
jgi:CRP/FNR family transcriptional regulator, cyclic AMP receptor protein